MREIIKFPEYKIAEKTEWRCKSKSSLRKAIEDGTAKSERWIHVNLPSVDEHIMHPTGLVAFISV
ncbi:hypothetical protein P5673_031710 [Acropora cervicornis]|uniref:Uncharacterized protein n=1 Tax=Acropora cervicornis TaxID=6130 RepID=A0AAD9USE2_ACRCE|nr:hypothetical protein P5673_031710 [Acropora cervicornis]